MIPEYFQTDRLVSRIRMEFPDLRWEQHRLVWTGSGVHGGDHAMLLLDDRLIFRFPEPDMVDAFRFELAILNELRSAIRLYVPEYSYLAADKSFGGCEPIRGTRLTPSRFKRLGKKHRERMARDFARFLNAVHSFPVDCAREIGATTMGPELTDPNPPGLMENLRAVERHLTTEEHTTIHGLIMGLSNREVCHGKPVVTHGDVWHKNIFYDPGHKALAGVIDWNVTIRDAALDFFGLCAYGEDLVDSVLSSYNYAYDGLKEHSRDLFYDVFMVACLLVLRGSTTRVWSSIPDDFLLIGYARAFPNAIDEAISQQTPALRSPNPIYKPDRGMLSERSTSIPVQSADDLGLGDERLRHPFTSCADCHGDDLGEQISHYTADPESDQCAHLVHGGSDKGAEYRDKDKRPDLGKATEEIACAYDTIDDLLGTFLVV